MPTGTAGQTLTFQGTAWQATSTLYVSSAGYLGIGTSSPWADLSINQAAGNIGLAIGSTSATSFIVDQNGNVGIGRSPSYRLDVQGTATTATLGSEIIANGTFDTDLSSWTATDWTWSSGKALHTAGNTSALSEATSTTANVYRVTFTIAGLVQGSGESVTVTFGYLNGSYSFSVNGAYTENFVATTTQTQALTFTPTSGAAATIDSVSVKAITGTLPAVVFRMNNDDSTVGLEMRSGGGGLYNTLVGVNAGALDTTGSITAFGNGALFANTSGNYNLAVGRNALNSNTSGNYNTAVGGYNTLASNSTGSYDTAIGYLALYRNNAGSYNTAIGHSALTNTTTGSYNTAIGSALVSNNTGSYNTAMGYYALVNNNSASYNTAVGDYALSAGTSAASSTAVGYQAGYRNQTGPNNTILGFQAGYGVSSNSYSNNIFIGARAAYAVTTGSNNILLGYQAGDAITSGANNILIGYDIDAQSATGSNQLSIGNLIFATGGFGTGTAIGTGSVGIGTTTPLAELTASSTSVVTGLFDQRGTNDILQLQASGVTKVNVNSSGYLGIGTTTPMSALSVNSTASPQMALAYDATHYGTFGIDSSGNLTINANGGKVLFGTGVKVGIASSTPWWDLSVGTPGNGTTSSAYFTLGNGYCMYQDNSTTTPNMTMGRCP